MLKKIIIIVVLLALTALGVLAFALWNANVLVARFKPQIEAKAGEALGSRVTLGEIDTEIFPSTRLRIEELKVAEPGVEGSFRLSDLVLNLNLPALLSRKLEITKLGLTKPQIVLIRNHEGLRLAGLPPKKPSGQPMAAAKSGAEGERNGGEALEVDLRAIEVRNASVVIQDRIKQKEYAVRSLNVSAALNLAGGSVEVDGLTFDGNALGKADFGGSVDKLTLRDDRLLMPGMKLKALESTVKASVDYNLKSKSGKITVNADRFDAMNLMALARDLVPTLNDIGVRGYLRPIAEIELLPDGGYTANGVLALSDVSVEQTGRSVSELEADISIAASQGAQSAETAKASFKFNGSPMTGGFAAEVRDKSLNLKDVSLTGFGGELTGDFRGQLEGEKPFSAGFSGTGFELGQALTAFGTSSKSSDIEGTVKSIKGKLSGALAGDVKGSLQGTVALDLENGLLKGVNLAREVLKEIKDLPFLEGALYSAAPPEVRTVLDTDSTTIEKLQGDFAVSGGRLKTDNFKLASEVFDLEGAGSMGFDSSVDFKAVMFFNRHFVGRLIESNKNLKFMADEEGRLVVPLQIRGTLPKVLVVPDLKKLLERGGKSALKEQAEKAIDKYAPEASGLKELLRKF